MLPLAQMRNKSITINGITTHYQQSGQGPVLILLPGWQLTVDKYQEVIDFFSKDHAVYALDLPGFGKSDTPKNPWTLNDYVNFLEQFIRTLKIQDYSIIAHSFGSRIAIKLAAQKPAYLKNIILTGAAGIKHRLTLKQTILFMTAKIAKLFFSLPLLNKLKLKLAKRLLGHKDYYKVGPIMKETMKLAINENLRPFLSQIHVPTLLIWGAKDQSTPVSDARIMHENIHNSELEIIADADHGLPYRKVDIFCEKVNDFLSGLETEK